MTKPVNIIELISPSDYPDVSSNKYFGLCHEEPDFTIGALCRGEYKMGCDQYDYFVNFYGLLYRIHELCFRPFAYGGGKVLGKGKFTLSSYTSGDLEVDLINKSVTLRIGGRTLERALLELDYESFLEFYTEECTSRVPVSAVKLLRPERKRDFMTKTKVVQWVYFLAALLLFFSGLTGDSTACLILAGVSMAFLLREFSAAWRAQELEGLIADLQIEVMATRTEISTIKDSILANQRNSQKNSPAKAGQ